MHLRMVIAGSALVGLILASAVLLAQDPLFRLHEVLRTTLVTMDDTPSDKWSVSYLLDNGSCVILVTNTETKQFAITEVNKSSCKGLSITR